MKEKNYVELFDDLDKKYGDIDNYPEKEVKKLRESKNKVIEISGFNENEIGFLVNIRRNNLFSIVNDYVWWLIISRANTKKEVPNDRK